MIQDIASSLSKGYAFAEYTDGTITDQVKFTDRPITQMNEPNRPLDIYKGERGDKVQKNVDGRQKQ